MLLIVACHALLILAANPSTGNPVAEIENESSQRTFSRDANNNLPFPMPPSLLSDTFSTFLPNPNFYYTINNDALKAAPLFAIGPPYYPPVSKPNEGESFHFINCIEIFNTFSFLNMKRQVPEPHCLRQQKKVELVKLTHPNGNFLFHSKSLGADQQLHRLGRQGPLANKGLKDLKDLKDLKVTFVTNRPIH